MEKIIKNAVFNTISIITIWGLINYSNAIDNFNLINDYNYESSIKYVYLLTGLGTSLCILRKYY